MASNSITIVKLGLVVTFLCAVISGRVTTVTAAVTCNQVISSLIPCLPYVTGGGNPSTTCCNGVRQLNAGAKTTSDRKAVCGCLKEVINGATYSKQAVINAAALPHKCNVNIPYPINPNVDCNTIKM